MFLLLLIALVVIFNFNTAFAQPLEDVAVNIVEFDGTHASIKLVWNHDETVTDYEVGCVSCFPNFSEKTDQDETVLFNVTALANGKAILYVIAYDDEIITAKQVMITIK